MEVGGQRHAPAALPPWNRPNTHYTGRWVGLGAGMDGYGKVSPPTGDKTPDRPARSESLYQLRYPSCQYIYVWIYIKKQIVPHREDSAFLLEISDGE
jgi:hypothetical protein